MSIIVYNVWTQYSVNTPLLHLIYYYANRVYTNRLIDQILEVAMLTDYRTNRVYANRLIDQILEIATLIDYGTKMQKSS